jgi:3-oxoacyl-[acyl-carrier-protein] synthase II
MNNKRVVITGLGVISSIGIGWQEFWDNLLKGKSGISSVSSFDTTNHFTHNGGEVKYFKAEEFIPIDLLKSINRSTQMALAATDLAIRDSALRLDEIRNHAVGVSFGTTLGDAQTIEDIDDSLVNNKPVNKNLILQTPTYSAPSYVAKKYEVKGPTFMFTTACASGNYAICHGYDLIKLKRADIILAGASDAFSRIEYTGFNQLSAVAPDKCQPFDKKRKGMIVAEGAGILILESLDNALKRNAHIYAEILGYGLSCDAQHMTQPSIEGVSQCMIKAMHEANINRDDVDYISAHGTGTLANDRTECAAIKEVFGIRYKKIPISSIKSMLGHTMGAASALESITCCLAIKNNIIPPTINFETPDPECDIDCVPNKARHQVVNIALNNAYAFGGNNASLVVNKFS